MIFIRSLPLSCSLQSGLLWESQPAMAPYNLPRQMSSTDLSFLPDPQHQRPIGPQNQHILCALCRRFDCHLVSHKSYLSRGHRQGFRQHDISRLIRTSFASSYSFNPLSVAIDHVCDKLDVGFDLRDLGTGGSLAASLNKFISYDISGNVPFTDPTGPQLGEVAAEWLVASAVDEIACVSTLNLWLHIEWTNTQSPRLERFSSQLTTLFLELLRKKIQGQDAVTDGTIFAASNHLSTYLMYFKQTNTQREVIMNGLEALVNARGGFDRLADAGHPGLFQGLLWSDILFSCFTGSRPRFHIAAPPLMPPSLIPERNATSSSLPAVYRNCCGPDLLDTAKYLRFFLLFRHQAEVRQLSKSEYRYMVSLERYIHIQLLEQSARYHETGSIAECMILAMGLMRMTVLCIWEQHVMIRRSYTERLERALHRVSDKSWSDVNATPALVWVCWVLLAQKEARYSSQNAILRSMAYGLREILGWNLDAWPDGWERGFGTTFQPLLWHADYEAHIPSVVSRIRDCLF